MPLAVGELRCRRRTTSIKRVRDRLRSIMPLHGRTVAKSDQAPSRHESRMKRPNIIFIVADDLGYADLGCYGGRGCRCRRCSTAWRRNGLRFTQGYANSPVCSPTRFALMTGALPVPAARRGRRADQQQEPRQHHARPAARASDPALAAASDSGYRTALIGKWHLGYPPAFGPLRSGYEEFFGPDVGRRRLLHAIVDSRGAHDLWFGEEEKPRRGLPHRPDLAPRRRLHRAHAPASDAPFFLSLHYTAPHWPWETRDDAALAARGEGQPVPPARRQHPHLSPHDPPHGRGHRLGHGRAAQAHGVGRRHAGRLHQRQRRRALLRQLAAGRRQDGPDRRRHPRALDRALAGA